MKAEGGKTLDSRGLLAFLAGFLAWTFDAFDFFILTYIVPHVAREFHASVTEIAATLTASLLMRPVGAFVFGLISDRWGRRLPLMLDIIFFSLMEILSGLAPTYRIFFLLRLLYGVGMGGVWGVGASLAMESVPTKWRGVLSGLLQEGYAIGNLLAAIAFWTVFPHWGWRPMFFIGAGPALLTLIVLLRVQESDSWKARASENKGWGEYFRVLGLNWKRFLYLVVLMAMMNCMSHGTQDLFPTFLQIEKHFTTQQTAIATAISMVGAIIGGTVVGFCSDRYGRRRAMVVAALLAVFLIPLWIFAPGIASISLGAFLIQFMVQGAWGVIPAHINELSPAATRGFLPGFAYQVGVLIAASAPRIQAAMAVQYGYARTMAVFAATVFVIGAIVIGVGPEEHRKEF
jgi:MFS transporter, SHS family, lactate transporter